MSYDVWMEADLGAGRQRVGDLDLNYTYNCAPMLYGAIGSSLRDFDGKPGADVAPALRSAIDVMQRDRERFLEMNPSNGWGDLDSWIVFLDKIAEACDAAPNAVLVVG